ncbi:acyltransferase [Chromohalobacter israelensis]|nr:acyltransferase [Chromohalobacter israelensis]
MALSVMLYHFFSWSVGVPESDSLLGRLGIYAVSSFYIVSGISLYLVYRNSRWGWREIKSFGLKRFLRLSPVYWLATALMVVLYSLGNNSYEPDWFNIFENLFLVFGLYNPDGYIPVGGWSIGNEFSFYVFFSLLMLSLNKRWVFASLMIFGLLSYGVFCFFILSSDKSLAQQWGDYINPLNQVFLFFSGVVAAWLKERYYSPGKKGAFIIACAAIFVFVFYPASGDKINIVTGWARFVFTSTCLAVCFSLLCMPNLSLKWLSKPLGFLGDRSYTIYMLHGASFLYFDKYVAPSLGIGRPEEKLVFLLFGLAPFVLLISFFVYRYLEVPFIQLGRKLSVTYTERKANKGPASAGWF